MDQPMTAPGHRPSWRKPVGMLAVLSLIVFWAFIVGSQSTFLGRLHWALQGLIYLAAGIVWIFPAMPILRWMETGRFRK